MPSIVFVPELKGRSLEQIDALFASRVSAIRSAKWQPVSLSQDAEGGARSEEDFKLDEERKEKI